MRALSKGLWRVVRVRYAIMTASYQHLHQWLKMKRPKLLYEINYEYLGLN